MTFESDGLLIGSIYIWLPPASYVVFLTTLVASLMHPLLVFIVIRFKKSLSSQRLLISASIWMKCGTVEPHV